MTAAPSPASELEETAPAWRTVVGTVGRLSAGGGHRHHQHNCYDSDQQHCLHARHMSDAFAGSRDAGRVVNRPRRSVGGRAGPREAEAYDATDRRSTVRARKKYGKARQG